MIAKKYFFMISVFMAFLALSLAISKAEIANPETGDNYTASDITKNAIFDIFVTIPQNYEHVVLGEELLTNIKLVNLGSSGRIDVVMHYEIKDADDLPIIVKKETVAVETQANFIKSFDIPLDAETGSYKIYAKIIYADRKEAVSEASFEIIRPENRQKVYDFAYGLIIIIVLAILIYIAIKSKAVIERIRMKLEIRRIVRKKLS